MRGKADDCDESDREDIAKDENIFVHKAPSPSARSIPVGPDVAQKATTGVVDSVYSFVSANSSLRNAGKSSTSRIECLSSNNIERRSMPIPKPPFGGIP